MPNLNLFTISGITIVITYIPLMFFVARALKTNKKLLSYLLHLISIFLWGIGSIAIGLCTSQAQADFVWRFAYIPVIFISVNFFYSSLKLNNKNKRITFIIFYTQAFIFSIMSLSGALFYPSKIVLSPIFYAQANSLFTLHFVIWTIIIFYGHIEIFKIYQKSINTTQNLFLLLITPIGFSGGITNFLGLYNIPFIHIGNFSIVLYSIICTYAILRHEFLDIKIIIKKSVIYTILLSMISVIYLITVIISERFLQNIVGYQSLAMNGAFAFALGLLFIPLKNAIEALVTRYFFKGSPQELSEQIQKYSVQIEESDRHKTAAALAGSVAHEIRNPLTAINTFLEKFPENENDPEFRKKFHTIVSHEVKRIKNLATNLMDFSKPAVLKLSTCDICQILDDVLLLAHQKLQNQNIRLDKRLAPEPLTLTGDKDQLKQVFLNLILNAGDAMDHGGTLTVETHMDTPTNDRIEIRITDTGCGISPENQRKLFEPFFTTKSDGTGLGLSICKRIIETHGGMIEVKSAVGKGTEFRIVLPTGTAENTAQN